MPVDAGRKRDNQSCEQDPITHQTDEMRDCLTNLQAWVEGQRAATQTLINSLSMGRSRVEEPDDKD